MKRRGFTAVEMLMVVVVASILVVASLPDQDAADSQKALNFAMKLEADIAYAQSLSLAQPGDPVRLRIDTGKNHYWLERSSVPDTPITHPHTGKPYLIVAGAASGDGFEGVSFKHIDFDGDDALTFDGVGGVDQDHNAVIQIAIGSTQVEIDFSTTTGSTTMDTNVDGVAGINGATAAAAGTGGTGTGGTGTGTGSTGTGSTGTGGGTTSSMTGESGGSGSGGGLLSQLLGGSSGSGGTESGSGGGGGGGGGGKKKKKK